MLRREHIEKLLSLNGVPKDATDDEIKSVLLSAHWHKDDVKTAILVLRENPTTHAEKVSTVHTIFTSDNRLNSETINALLGINMETDATVKRNRQKKSGHTFGFYLHVIVAGVLVSLVFLLWLMWTSQTGFFHVTVR